MNTSYTFKNKIRELRLANGWTQEQLAERLYVTTGVVSSWERFGRLPKPDITEEIKKIFKIEEKELFGTINIDEMELAAVKTHQTILCGVANNTDCAKSIEYYGAKETFWGYKAFLKEHENAIKADDTQWIESNSFTCIYDTEKDEICGIRDYGQYAPLSEDFLFKGKFLPISLEYDSINNEKNLEEVVESAFLSYEKEMNIARTQANGRTILFLCSSVMKNIHEVYNATTGNIDLVDEFKIDKDTFILKTRDDNAKVVSTKDYYIHVPGSDFRNRIGINLYEYAFLYLQEFDKADYILRKKTPVDCPIKYRDIYSYYLNMVNNYREKGKYDKFQTLLEIRLTRFEKLILLNAPEEIIEREVSLMKKAANGIC